MITSKTFLALLFLTTLLLTTPSIGSCSPGQLPNAVWLIPAFLELPVGWAQRRFRTEDSRGIQLSDGKYEMTLDYGLRYGDSPGCSIRDLTETRRFSDLKCGKVQGHKMRLVFVDPLDPSFELLITVSAGAEDNADHSGQELRILKTMAFVGEIDKLRILSVDQQRRTATVRYENGWVRTLHLGDTVSRDFGTLLEVGHGSVQVKIHKLREDGGFEAKIVTLRVA